MLKHPLFDIREYAFTCKYNCDVIKQNETEVEMQPFKINISFVNIIANIQPEAMSWERQGVKAPKGLKKGKN